MINAKTFREIALSFSGVEEKPHFERRAFTVMGRKIFATLHALTDTANILLSKTDQDVYSSFDKTAVYPVPNKFGAQGWTTFDLKKVPVELIADALLTAYNTMRQTKKKK